MGKRLKIDDAAAETGLSRYALRKGVAEGRYPYIRTSGRTGKIYVDIQLLEQALEREALSNAQQSQTAANVVNYGQLRAVKP